MSEELQNETTANVEPVIEDQAIGAELATASESGHEQQPKVELSAEDKAAKAQKATEKVINEKTFKYHEEKRKNEALQGQLDEIERKEQEQLADTFKVDPLMPVTPTFPDTDQFDDNYESDMNKYRADIAKYNTDMPVYHQKVQEKANFVATQTALSNQTLLQQQAEQLAVQQRSQKIIIEHAARARALNINESEMMQAENILINSGLPKDLMVHVASKENSPLIIKHLAENSAELFSLMSASDYAVDTILNKIATDAKALQPNTTSTPAPVNQLPGSGAVIDNGEFPNSSGAKFY